MGDTEDVIHAEVVRVGLMCSQQLGQEVNPGRIIASVRLLSFAELLNSDLGHGGGLRFPEW